MESSTVGTSKDSLESTPAYSFEQHYVFLSGHIVHLNAPLPIFKDLAAKGHLSKDEYLKLEVALQEAITNAVDHGNLELSSTLREEFDEQGNDKYSKLKEERLKDNRYASRFVFISAYANAKEVLVRVRDEGNGFENEKKPETSLVESDLPLPRCSGRGLILIRAASDSLKFNDAGNQLEFVKAFELGE